jgi:hypothetical protein
VEKELRRKKAGPRLRAAVRGWQSKPVLQRLHRAMELVRRRTLPQGLLGQAIDYALKRWEALNRFVDDGVLEIDTNLLENLIRPSALGKNYAEVVIMRRCGGCFADAGAFRWLDKESTAHN